MNSYLKSPEKVQLCQYIDFSPMKLFLDLLSLEWASLVAQLVKNLPAMQETWVQIPGLGRSPGEGKGKATHSSILA